MEGSATPKFLIEALVSNGFSIVGILASLYTSIFSSLAGLCHSQGSTGQGCKIYL